MGRLLSIMVVAFASWSASATIYLAAFDPNTRAMGLAYSSSGAHFWQTLVRGKGLVGAQSYGLCEQATPQKFLEQGLTAKDVVGGIYQQCHAAGWENYRVLAVTSDGAIEWVFGAQGCSSENPVCGGMRGENFAVTGGGLHDGVLDAAVRAFESTDKRAPLACRLFKALQGVYAAGGELKEFRGASLTVDDPSLPALQDWRYEGAKKDLLQNLDNQMKKSGVNCP